MELQAIREKLQQLQAEPPAAEALTLPLPWADVGSSGRYDSRYDGRYDGSAETTKAVQARIREQTAKESQAVSAEETQQCPQEKAIEALKQRSRGHDQAAIARIDNLVAQEIYRLEVQASNINERSQQQAADIMALKRSAQQAAVGLRRQGIQDHPQLAAITEFLERYQSAVVPHIERDTQGRFELTYDTIDFQQAEQEAMDNAHTLRNRRRPPSAIPTSIPTGAFVEPIAPARSAGSENSYDYSEESYPENNDGESQPWLDMARQSFASGMGKFSGLSALTRRMASPAVGLLSGQSKRRHRQKLVTAGDFAGSTSLFSHDYEEGLLANGFGAQDASAEMLMDAPYEAEEDAARSQFSWLDGTIWFSGAAIARIVIQSVAASYPIVQTVALLALVSIIVFAIYRVITSKTHDYSLVYRLCIAMLGLFLAGLF